jgi:hypothetical protein
MASSVRVARGWRVAVPKAKLTSNARKTPSSRKADSIVSTRVRRSVSRTSRTESRGIRTVSGAARTVSVAIWAESRRTGSGRSGTGAPRLPGACSASTSSTTALMSARRRASSSGGRARSAGERRPNEASRRGCTDAGGEERPMRMVRSGPAVRRIVSTRSRTRSTPSGRTVCESGGAVWARLVEGRPRERPTTRLSIRAESGLVHPGGSRSIEL